MVEYPVCYLKVGLRTTSSRAVHRRQNQVAQKTPRKTLAQNGENIFCSFDSLVHIPSPGNGIYLRAS
jgi:hypothetical protein